MCWKPVRRTNLPYKDEAKYSKTSKEETNRVDEVDAHVFLEYCRLRGQVAQMIRSELQAHSALGVIGFLTGSVGLLASARPYVEQVRTARLAYVRGRSHTGPGETKDVTVGEYLTLLDDLTKTGMRRIVLVDEIVGGGQMSGGLNSTAEWQKKNHSTTLTVSVVGCYDDEVTADGKELIGELDATTCWEGISLGVVQTFHAPRLLEKDKAGLAYRATKKGTEPGTYEFKRENPAGFAIVCPCGGGVSLAVSASSLDMTFSNDVAAVLGQSRGPLYAHITNLVNGSGCATCKTLLATARGLGLPQCW